MNSIRYHIPHATRWSVKIRSRQDHPSLNIISSGLKKFLESGGVEGAAADDEDMGDDEDDEGYDEDDEEDDGGHDEL